MLNIIGGAFMKVIVTGGAGFIGSHIVDLLIENKHEVVVVDSLVHGKKENINKQAKFYCMDICDLNIRKVFEKEKPEVVIHEAAQISVVKSIENPIFDANINIIGTLNILECCRKYGVKKIIYPALAASFGEPKYLPIDEKHPLEMISAYGVSKHTMEHYLDVYKKLYNLDYIVLRYANVYGPRQDSTGEGGVVSIFAEKMLRDESPYIFGDGTNTRDFVFVKDVAKANYMAMLTDKVGIYNVSTNTKISINQLFQYFNVMLRKNLKPMYTSKRKGDIEHSYMSFEKIYDVLGWKPAYDIVTGLKETIEYYGVP